MWYHHRKIKYSKIGCHFIFRRTVTDDAVRYVGDTAPCNTYEAKRYQQQVLVLDHKDQEHTYTPDQQGNGMQSLLTDIDQAFGDQESEECRQGSIQCKTDTHPGDAVLKGRALRIGTVEYITGDDRRCIDPKGKESKPGEELHYKKGKQVFNDLYH